MISTHLVGMENPVELAKMQMRGIDRTRSFSNQSGSTLVELLAVVVLLALFATIATARLTAHGGAAQARATLFNTSDILRNARLTAITTGREQVVYVDVLHRRIVGTGRRPLQVPKELGFSAVTAQLQQRDKDAFGIRFFPDGSSTGGKLQFAMQGKLFELHVNWLTGNVTISDG